MLKGVVFTLQNKGSYNRKLYALDFVKGKANFSSVKSANIVWSKMSKNWF
jgi:hypothetical protein